MNLTESIVESFPDALLVVGSDGRLRLANREAERFFGLERDRLAERTIGHLIRGGLGAGRPGSGAELTAEAIGADGDARPITLTLRPIAADDGTATLCLVREADPVGDRLREALREKELLLQEIHHRVKNNLSVVASLLYMQTTRTSDPATIATLTQGQDRIRSMAMVHETLYRTGNLAAVPFDEYAGALCRELERSHRLPGQPVRVTTRIERVAIRIEAAVPCGLIINELVTNALRHAFPAGRAGEVHVALRRVPGTPSVELEVRDDGVGPGEASGAPGGTLGLRLVESLALQVRGLFTLAAGHPGTRATLVLPLEPALA
ncbi:MAG: PAS domain S-box protein [Gemmatimonadaceae bacterium]|nr:PAS domain S-box protein [Gemmatimonadaceae bacterium]